MGELLSVNLLKVEMTGFDPIQKNLTEIIVKKSLFLLFNELKPSF